VRVRYINKIYISYIFNNLLILEKMRRLCALFSRCQNIIRLIFYIKCIPPIYKCELIAQKVFNLTERISLILQMCEVHQTHFSKLHTCAGSIC
jgi:hypothetical protein